ncbi:MAG: hypothetical protein E7470_09015 [Ruminococcaceae bacterium]|nr:hypothetical protein [Oscillospiraceae bacterium]
MKKLICAFLLLSILCSFAACNGGEKVTIYVPDKITEYGGDTFTTYLLYEKNWQKKESFTVSYSEGNTTITYADRHTMTRGNGTQVDEYMDESGNVVSRAVFHETSSQLIQSVLTYDEHGRILTQTTSTSFSGGKDTYLPQVTFTYEETEQGSKGVGEQSGYVETYFYDKAYRMIGYSVTIMGVESSRTEYSYDKHGNRTEIAVYANGTLDTRSVITYKAIEVSLEMADRLPQFKREN